MQRRSAASDATTTEMYRLMVACLCVMVGNAETECCFSCQNHRDVSVDGGLSVRDGGECRDGALLQLPKSHKDEAALQPHSRASRSAHESELIWGRAGGV